MRLSELFSTQALQSLMRLTDIQTNKQACSLASQPLFPAPGQLLVPLPPPAKQSNVRNRLVEAVSPLLFEWKLRSYDREFGHLLPGCRFTCGQRFSNGWIWQRFKQATGSWDGKRVLLPGSHFNTPEARRWFGRSVQALHLLDIVDWQPSFVAAGSELRNLCRAGLSFHHGTLDKLPLPDASVDIVESRAVLEHVGNLAASMAEMARVLAPGGVMLHSFGPLYFAHGGDHCIAAYGPGHGYDHLLLDDEDYRRNLLDEAAFDRFGKEASDSRYWAVQGIFSYLRPREYLDVFATHFDFMECLAIISPEALDFRQSRPDLWQRLQQSGLDEADLLISGMSVILRKKEINQG